MNLIRRSLVCFCSEMEESLWLAFICWLCHSQGQWVGVITSSSTRTVWITTICRCYLSLLTCQCLWFTEATLTSNIVFLPWKTIGSPIPPGVDLRRATLKTHSEGGIYKGIQIPKLDLMLILPNPGYLPKLCYIASAVLLRLRLGLLVLVYPLRLCSIKLWCSLLTGRAIPPSCMKWSG